MATPFGIDDGTAGLDLVFPMSWPLPQDVRLATLPTLVLGQEIELVASRRGSIEVWFTHRGKRQKVFTSAYIDFRRGGEGRVYISWSRAGVSLSLWGADIPPSSATTTTHYLELTPAFPGTGAVSVKDTEAIAECGKWVDWRKAHLSGDKVPVDRVAKTLPEQLHELRSAVARIKDILRFLDEGHLHWLGSLAVELRALIYWRASDFEPKNQKRKNKCIPLLFRLAQYKDLALPVYMLAPQTHSILDATQVRFDTFTLTHTSGHQVGGDLQEWLSHPAFLSPEQEAWAMKDVIAGYAETLGPGHYDSGVPSALSFLRQGYGNTATFAVQFLHQVATSIVPLAEYVVLQVSLEP